MTLVPYDINKLGNVCYRFSDNYKILSEFTESGEMCMKLEGYPHNSVKSCQTSLLSSIKRFNFHGIKIVIRGEDVFLVKKD